MHILRLSVLGVLLPVILVGCGSASGDGFVASLFGGNTSTLTELENNEISGTAEGDDFVLYKTNIELDHSDPQPAMTLPSMVSTESYRFDVSALAAGPVDLARVSLQLNLNGIEFETMPVVGAYDGFFVRAVNNGVVDTNSMFPINVAPANLGIDEVMLEVDLSGQRVSADGTLTYALFVAPTVEDDNGAQDSDGINVTFLQDNMYEVPSNFYEKLATGGCTSITDRCMIVWSDESGSPHNTDSEDWFNGFETKVDLTPFRLLKNN